MPSPPRVQDLDRPAPLQEILKKDNPEDCLPCKVMGATAFIGLGAYSYFSGHQQLRAQREKIVRSNSIFGMRSRQAGVTSIALALAGMGFWRLTH